MVDAVRSSLDLHTGIKQRLAILLFKIGIFYYFYFSLNNQQAANSSNFPNTSYFVLCVTNILLLDKNSSVSDLTVLEVVQSLLNTLLVEGVLHGSRSDVLSGDKLKELADAVARTDKRSLDADTLERELSQGNGSGLESSGERVDGAVVVDDGGKTIIC